MGEYYTNKEVKAKIDAVLHANAMLFQNLGKSSTKAEREAASIQERKNLREVRNLSKTFVDSLLKEN